VFFSPPFASSRRSLEWEVSMKTFRFSGEREDLFVFSRMRERNQINGSPRANDYSDYIDYSSTLMRDVIVLNVSISTVYHGPAVPGIPETDELCDFLFMAFLK
jgi:hypothetical protein